MRLFSQSTKGYTFVELMTAISIFAVVMVMVTTIAVNFNASQQRERARNLVITETQFLLGRISEAIRTNAIDYAEYYSNYSTDQDQSGGGDIIYGDDPREYDWHFYNLPTCEVGMRHGSVSIDHTCDREDENKFYTGYFDTGADFDTSIVNNIPSKSALVNPTGEAGWSDHRQLELYLIDKDGTKKTIFRRTGNGIDDDNDGQEDEDNAYFWIPDADGGERLSMIELTATRDINGDLYHYIDFEPTEDYGDDEIVEEADFVPITPKNIDIVNLEFHISPLDDPRKADSPEETSARVQPFVTILLTTRAGANLRGMHAGETTLSLQTTVSSRILTSVIFPDLQ